MPSALFALPCLLAQASPAPLPPPQPPSLAHPSPQLQPPPPPLPLLGFLPALELSSTQQAQLRKCLEGRRATLGSLHEGLVRAQRALQTALQDPDLPPAQLQALCAGEARARLAQAQETHALLREATALLDPGQLQTYRKILVALPLVQGLLEGPGAPWAPGGPGACPPRPGIPGGEGPCPEGRGGRPPLPPPDGGAPRGEASTHE